MESWLKKRLSPYKSETDRWKQLADTLELFWENNFDSYLDRQNNLRSVFTASNEDRLRILSELGKYYDVDIDQDSIPLAVIQRRIELFQKDSLVPLTNSLRRACPGVSVTWRPQYARVNRPYGERFYSIPELVSIGKSSWITNKVKHLDGAWKVSADHPEKLLESVFQTSRGRLFIDDTETDTARSITDSTIRKRAGMVLPAHIVLDGLVWNSNADLSSLWGFSEKTSINSNFLAHVSAVPSLNGAWKIGSDSRRISLSGAWKLDGSKQVGEIIPFESFTKIGHKVIPNSTISSLEQVYVGENRVSYPKLNGVYKIGAGWKIGDQLISMWPEVDLNIYLDGSVFLDGTWYVGGEI